MRDAVEWNHLNSFTSLRFLKITGIIHSLCMRVCLNSSWWRGRDLGFNFPPPVPFNPGSHPILLAPASLLFIDCRILCNVAQVSSVPPATRHLGNSASRPSSPTSRTPPAPSSPGLLRLPGPLHRDVWWFFSEGKLRNTGEQNLLVWDLNVTIL